MVYSLLDTSIKRNRIWPPTLTVLVIDSPTRLKVFTCLNNVDGISTALLPADCYRLDIFKCLSICNNYYLDLSTNKTYWVEMCICFGTPCGLSQTNSTTDFTFLMVIEGTPWIWQWKVYVSTMLVYSVVFYANSYPTTSLAKCGKSSSWISIGWRRWIIRCSSAVSIIVE